MKILSLNLCTSWTLPRKERLQIVADFVKANKIDVLLVQEGLRVCFVYDTIRQLARMLDYNYFAKTPWGVPFFAESRVAILTKFNIISTASLNPAVHQTEWLDAIPIPWRKRAVSVAVDVPDLGIVNLISVHLCSSPKNQLGKALELSMVDVWRKLLLPPKDVEIYGGDFNTSFGRDGFGFPPDYIFVEGATIIIGEQVLTGQIVTDHKCGILVEVTR